MFCCRFRYSIAPSATIHTPAMTPIATPAFCPLFSPPGDSFNWSFSFTLLLFAPAALLGDGGGVGGAGGETVGDGEGDDPGAGEPVGDGGGAGGEVGKKCGDGAGVCGGGGETGAGVGGGDRETGEGVGGETGEGAGCGCTERSDERRMTEKMGSFAIAIISFNYTGENLRSESNESRLGEHRSEDLKAEI